MSNDEERKRKEIALMGLKSDFHAWYERACDLYFHEWDLTESEIHEVVKFQVEQLAPKGGKSHLRVVPDNQS